MKLRAGPITVLLAAFAFAAPALARGGRRRPRRKEPKVGQAAPDFELVKLGENGKEGEKGKKGEKDSKVKLSEQWAKKPLVLIFSSYT
jgi:hypothetical protein